MTRKQYASVARYIRRVADLMGLRDWTFTLDHNPAEGEHTLAAVETTFGRKHATIQVCPNFANLEPELQRHVIVHELLHVHLGGIKDFTYRALPTLLGEAAWSAFESAYRMQDELATDGIADAIAGGFPLWEG